MKTASFVRLALILVVALVPVLSGCADVTGPHADAADVATDVGTDAAPAVAPCAPGQDEPCRTCTATGWLPRPDTTGCTDGNACTQGDHCAAGVCVAGAAKDCADLSPCTTDVCDPITGCQWLPTDATCTDGNPCTVNEHCADGDCKSDAKHCGDDNPCTNDSCDAKTGACGHVSNGQEHCVPRFTLSWPPHGLQWTAPEAGILVAGKVHSDSGPVAQVTLAGQVTAVAADGTFQAWVPLQWGSNVLVLTAVDAAAGQGQAMRAVHYSPAWTPLSAAGVVVDPAGAVQAGPAGPPPGLAAPAWLPATLPQPELLGAGEVDLQLVGTATPVAGNPGVAQAVTLAMTLTAAVADFAQSPGVPLRAACAVPPDPPALAPPAKVQGFLGLDALNAALWAIWRAGALQGDASALVQGTVLEIYGAKVWLQPLLPPLVTDCPGPGATVHLDDLHFQIEAQWKGTVLADVWLSLDAPLVVTCAAGQLRLTLGPYANVAAEVATNLVDTDFMTGLQAATVEVFLPELWDAWTATGLLTWPLPAAVGKGLTCKAVPGGVAVTTD